MSPHVEDEARSLRLSALALRGYGDARQSRAAETKLFKLGIARSLRDVVTIYAKRTGLAMGNSSNLSTKCLYF